MILCDFLRRAPGQLDPCNFPRSNCDSSNDLLKRKNIKKRQQVVIKPFMCFTVKQECLYSKNSVRGKITAGSFNAERL